jgi:sterol desaturase/sphingolipid hydroxylase (fatty acid hydroxylase superfamily)
MTAFPFAYIFIRYAYFAAPRVAWQLSEFTVTNTIVAIPLLYITYDFFYTILHGVLHIKGIYGLIHKHHHHQKAPSRGNTDAINVHPVEYILGEFNHLWALHVVCAYLGVQVHIVTALFFLVAGGYMASLNHTRYDLVVLGGIIYDSKAHDVHHRIPQSNYGQYTMFWDYVIGSYRAYNPNDRINPNSQLNLKTGKSLMYHEAAATKVE